MLGRIVEEARHVERFPGDRVAARRLAASAADLGRALLDLEQTEYAHRFLDLGSTLRSAAGGDTRQIPALAAYLVVTIELMRRHLDNKPGSDAEGAQTGEQETRPAPSGMEAADESFRLLNYGTSRLVQLLADEFVPLADSTLDEITRTIAALQAALPALREWDCLPASAGDWLLEPPFNQVGVRRTTASDFEDIENLERMRRSFEFLAPQSLALRKEGAILLIDALLAQLRRPRLSPRDAIVAGRALDTRS